jgi:hypothetical protein
MPVAHTRSIPMVVAVAYFMTLLLWRAVMVGALTAAEMPRYRPERRGAGHYRPVRG